MQGAVGFIAATAVALMASAYALEALRFSPSSILGFRVLILLAAAAFAGWFLVRPLMRKVSDEQVALYLEEHEPSLEAVIITAMDSERAGRAQEMSPALVRRMIEGAIERVQTDRRRPPHRACAAQALRDGCGRRHPRRAGRVRARAGVPASRALGAPHHLARCRSRGAVSHRSHARKRHRAEGCGSDDLGQAARLRSRRRDGLHAQGRERAVRARADGALGERRL